jgi:hypothetical protein
MELRAGRVLDAVIGPQHLFASRQRHATERKMPRVRMGMSQTLQKEGKYLFIAKDNILFKTSNILPFSFNVTMVFFK